MSILQSSFTSQNNSPTRRKSHSLCQQLQQLGTKVDTDIINTSKYDTQSDDNSFITPNSKNKLENQPQFDQPNKSIEEGMNKENILGELDEGKKEEDGKQDSSGPKTITLIEDDLISKDSISVNMSSKISQYSSEVDNQSFAAFLSVRDTSYTSLIKNFELLFSNVSNVFSQRLALISSTYLSFLKIKYSQQKSYQSQSLPLTQNKKNHIIYIDCKTVADTLATSLNKQKQKRSIYIKQLQQISQKLQKHIQSCISTLESKSMKIKQIYKRIEETVNQMTDLMIPLNRKKMKKSINQQIYSNAFIRTKYLMSKERLYLNLIATYLQAVLGFISYVCLDLEPQNCLIVKQSMLAYVEAMSNFSNFTNATQKNVQSLNKTNCFQQSYQQISQLLQLCIPDPLKFDNPIIAQLRKGERKLKYIIQSLISESQSLVYIPVIQLQSRDYAYHSKNKCKVKWIKVNHDQKYKSQTIEDHETYVILTHEGDLILQLLTNQQSNEEKMAILKLKNIKFSKKNNQLFITDKGSGMLGYLFASDSVLGSLIFQPEIGKGGFGVTEEALIDQFVQRVKDVLGDKKEKKGIK